MGCQKFTTYCDNLSDLRVLSNVPAQIFWVFTGLMHCGSGSHPTFFGNLNVHSVVDVQPPNNRLFAIGWGPWV